MKENKMEKNPTIDEAGDIANGVVDYLIQDKDTYAMETQMSDERANEVMSIMTDEFIEEFNDKFNDAVNAIDETQGDDHIDNEAINVGKSFAKHLREKDVLKNDDEENETAELLAEIISSAFGGC